MLSLANVAGSGTPIGGGYLAALPGVALYCAALVWGLMRAGKTLKGWGLAAVIWGIACPLVFGLLGLLGAMLAQDVLRGNEDFGMLLAMVVCSGVTALLLWKVTEGAGPPAACLVGCGLVVVVWAAIAPWSRESSLRVTLAAVWGLPVAGSLVMWGMSPKRTGPRPGNACVHELRGLKGEGCPECEAGAGAKR